MIRSPFRHAIGHRVAAVLGEAEESGPPPPPDPFFGVFSMQREFWAEDPAWTNPGDGNNLVTVRDNGSLALDLSAGGSVIPKYQAAGFGGKPSFDFPATSSSVGGYLTNAGGDVAGTQSVVLVGRLDSLADHPYLCDSREAERLIIGSTSGNWRGYHNAALNITPSAADLNPHVFTLVVKTNDLRLYVDGVLLGTDSAGTMATAITGFVLGCDFDLTGTSFANGAVPYAAQFSGDITAEVGYAGWLADIIDYYGI